MKKKKNLRLPAFIFAGLFFLLAAGIVVLPWLLRGIAARIRRREAPADSS